jgi:hypothetical protein
MVGVESEGTIVLDNAEGDRQVRVTRLAFAMEVDQQKSVFESEGGRT